ncbi:Uncharacterised protein [Raoultella ornithinolytica]|nr:Uncharacterised protein [Raoultella ornithinolytica]
MRKRKPGRKASPQSRLRPGCHDWLTEISERRRQIHTRYRRNQLLILGVILLQL